MSASAQDTSDDVIEKARTLTEQEKYEEAITLLRERIEFDKTNGRLWHRLGYILYLNQDLDGAIEANKRASKLPEARGISFFNLGCAYAMKDQADSAFAALNDAIASDYLEKDSFETDTDLLPIRNDKRFKELLSRLDAVVLRKQADRYRFGIGVERDYAKALRIYRLSLIHISEPTRPY